MAKDWTDDRVIQETKYRPPIGANEYRSLAAAMKRAIDDLNLVILNRNGSQTADFSCNRSIFKRSANSSSALRNGAPTGTPCAIRWR